MMTTAVQGRMTEDRELPVFSSGTGRGILIPVAEGSNVQCACCAPAAPCPHMLPSERAGTLRDPEDALGMIAPLLKRQDGLEEFCVAGPGEALVSPATRIVLRMLAWHYPSIGRSVWTNGLLLADQLDDLAGLGLNRVYITINASTRQAADRLYSRLVYRGRNYTGRAAGDLLQEKQWLGLSLAADRGIRAIVHSVLVPSVNDADLVQIAKKAGSLGADSMVLTSPDDTVQAEAESSNAVSMLRAKRRELSAALPQRDLFLEPQLR